MTVDGLGDVRRLAAHGIADVLDCYAVAAHDRHRGVPALVRVPVADGRAAGHLAESPVELVGPVGVAVLVDRTRGCSGAGGRPGDEGGDRYRLLGYWARGDLYRPEAHDRVHQRWGGAAGDLYSPDRSRYGRDAYAQ